METISIFKAFGEVMSHGSYWLWLFMALAVCAATYFFVLKEDIEKGGWTMYTILISFACIVLFFAALLIAPCEMAANTTVEQAARGVYIR